MILVWLVSSLVVRIFGLCCLGVRNFGFTVFWLAGSDSSTHLDLRLSVWMFAAGRMVLRVFVGSHGTLVAVSAPFMMPLRDSDIPMNVPFTFSNKQPLPPEFSSTSQTLRLLSQRSVGNATQHTKVSISSSLWARTPPWPASRVRGKNARRRNISPPRRAAEVAPVTAQHDVPRWARGR